VIRGGGLRASYLAAAARVAVLAARLAGTAFLLAMTGVYVVTGLTSHSHNAWQRGDVLLALLLALASYVISHVLLYRWGRDTQSLRRRLMRRTHAPRGALRAAAVRTGLEEFVVELGGPRTTAFTYGVWRPRIVVTTTLAEAMTPAQLDATLRHEESHLRRLDPLRRGLLAVAAATFWYVPLVRHWQSCQVVRQELLADRHAIDSCGSRAVAGALLVASRAPSEDLVAAMGNPSLLECRIAHLEGHEVPQPPVLTRSLVALSVLGVGLVAVVTSVALCITGPH
jgi:beta-lactamase regulating signal transducer with metallopeptidase domain